MYTHFIQRLNQTPKHWNYYGGKKSNNQKAIARINCLWLFYNKLSIYSTPYWGELHSISEGKGLEPKKGKFYFPDLILAV